MTVEEMREIRAAFKRLEHDIAACRLEASDKGHVLIIILLVLILVNVMK